jgi:hypothetical protein
LPWQRLIGVIRTTINALAQIGVDRRGGSALIGIDSASNTLQLNSFVYKKGGPHPRRSTRFIFRP